MPVGEAGRVGIVVTDKPTGLERESLVIKGVRSELRLEGGVIQITKEATTQARPTSVTIDVKTVRSSTVEPPRRGSSGRGWFHVATVNGSPAPVGELAASGDPYTLPITARSVGACRKLSKLIDKHVKERGLPADVGPNQGRFSSGVVVTGAVKPVAAPMVTLPDREQPEAQPAVAEPGPPDADEEVTPEPPRKRAVAKKAAKKAAKKTATKRTTKKTTKRAAKKATSGGATATPDRAAAATELVAQLRELGELHAAGVLSDDEFAAAKAKVLG